MVQLLHLYMTTGKTVTLTVWIFVGKLMSLLYNTLSRFVMAFLPRSKCHLISSGEIVLNIVFWGGEWRGPKESFNSLPVRPSEWDHVSPLTHFFIFWGSIPPLRMPSLLPPGNISRPLSSSETLELISVGQRHTKMKWLLDLKWATCHCVTDVAQKSRIKVWLATWTQ